MRTKLKKVGEDLALVLDRSTWNQLGLDGETEIEVAVDDTGIHIRQSPDGHRDRVLASAQRMMEVHEATFRMLAR
jgi:antitoxin component of MazEF toxin-antitoxin module